MPKFHVHVYDLACLCEVDVEAASPTEAMERALHTAKTADPSYWVKPDTQYLAVPFALDDDE